MENKNIKKKSTSNPHAGHRARLRQKVDRDPELDTMHDHELLELMLSFVIPRKDTNEIAHELIGTFGSLDSVFFATPKELMKIKNMTVPASYLIATQLPIARRAMRSVADGVDQRKFFSAEACMNEMHSFFYARKTECFALAFLDIDNKIIKMFQTVGYLATNIDVYVSDVLLKATREGAAKVIIAHNHPSGNLSPSPDDIILTRRIFEALANIDVGLIDHVIFSHNGYFSFSNNRIIQTMKMAFADKEKRFADTPESRRLFFLNLDEYVLVPDEIAKYDFEVAQRKEIGNLYKERITGHKM